MGVRRRFRDTRLRLNQELNQERGLKTHLRKVIDNRNPGHSRDLSSTPGGTRTPNLLIRSQTLYPN
jgi:hypothetical protein